ncbi:hypothetical protein [Leifsonia xyli]|nr:hypothetical protein [Leifsonia xyli]
MSLRRPRLRSVLLLAALGGAGLFAVTNIPAIAAFIDHWPGPVDLSRS